MRKNQMTVTIYKVDTNPQFSLEEFCDACHVTPDFIQELMEFGMIEPRKNHFTAEHLKRVRKALQLQHDFEVNLAGAVLAIDLLEKMEEMRRRIELLEKHWGKR